MFIDGLGVALGLANAALSVSIFTLVLLPISYISSVLLRWLIAIPLALTPLVAFGFTGWIMFQDFESYIPSLFISAWPLLLTGGLASAACLLILLPDPAHIRQWSLRRLTWLVVLFGFSTLGLLWARDQQLQKASYELAVQRWNELLGPPLSANDISDLYDDIDRELAEVPGQFIADWETLSSERPINTDDPNFVREMARLQPLIAKIIEATKLGKRDYHDLKLLPLTDAEKLYAPLEQKQQLLVLAAVLLNGRMELALANRRYADAVECVKARLALTEGSPLSIGVEEEGVNAADVTSMIRRLIEELTYQDGNLSSLPIPALNTYDQALNDYLQLHIALITASPEQIPDQHEWEPVWFHRSMVYRVLTVTRGHYVLQKVIEAMNRVRSQPWHHRRFAVDDTGVLEDVYDVQSTSSEQQWRLVVTAMAIAHYQEMHQSDPEELTDLVPEFLPTVPTDPFTGDNLKLNRSNTYLTVSLPNTLAADSEKISLLPNPRDEFTEQPIVKFAERGKLERP